MTFDDDFLQLEFQGGTKRVVCKSVGVTWPPPAHLNVLGFQMRRVSYSEISDEDRADMDFIMRGARYVPEPGEER